MSFKRILSLVIAVLLFVSPAGAQPPSVPNDPPDPGKLYYRVQDLTVEKGVIRADIAVDNAGPNDSDPTRMLCEFTDDSGKPYTGQEVTIPAMPAGTVQIFKVFSEIQPKDTSTKPRRYIVTCYFCNLVHPNLDPKTRQEWSRQAQERKR